MKRPLQITVVVALLLAAITIVWRHQRARSAQPPPETRKASVRMKWFYAGTMTGWFAGKNEGFFHANGIDLSITPGGPQNSSLKLVAAGSDQFGVAGADEVILARSKGVPVLALCVLFKVSPVCFVSRADSGIKGPSDWRGKRIEVSYGENAEYQFRALLKIAGLGKGDYSEVPYTFSVAPFLEGKVDVSPAYAMDQAIIIEKQGVALQRVFARDLGVNPYADVVIATERLVESEPDLARRFVAAVTTSQQWAIAHPDAAVGHLVASVPDLKLDDQLAVWRATIPYLTPQGDTTPFGVMTRDRWLESQRVLLDSGALSAPIDIDGAFTNTFLPGKQKQ